MLTIPDHIKPRGLQKKTNKKKPLLDMTYSLPSSWHFYLLVISQEKCYSFSSLLHNVNPRCPPKPRWLLWSARPKASVYQQSHVRLLTGWSWLTWLEKQTMPCPLDTWGGMHLIQLLGWKLASEVNVPHQRDVKLVHTLGWKMWWKHHHITQWNPCYSKTRTSKEHQDSQGQPHFSKNTQTLP